MIIVIDDERTFKSIEDVVYLRSLDEALCFFVKLSVNFAFSPMGTFPTEIDALYLDHDLGVGGDITMFVKYLLMNATLNRRGSSGYYIDQIYVHSQNPVGSEKIVSELKRAYPNVKKILLPTLDTPLNSYFQ